ncbi:hypothetical protein C7B67_02830 [filamentous cyanobacterium Phorm 6]|nr:hypothetical protein C7B67_02830 [filamentous cyanobacterium Phorm 6]
MAEGEGIPTSVQINDRDYSWPFWPIVPIYPYGKRRTIRKEIVKDTIWTFDQIQGIFYVVVPIRMTVIKLEPEGLLIYAPVAPTPECIRLVNELVAEHGEVKYILLTTVSGIEHKVFVGPFARCFPQAQVFVAPQQWSFPLNLPLSWLGLPAKRTSVLPCDSSETTLADQFDWAILGPIDLRLGWFAEVALFHRRSRTLMLTDAVVSIPENPPAIVQIDSYPLLFHAKDNALDMVADTHENRRKGWQRIALFAMYFRPSVLEVPPWSGVFTNAIIAPERSRKAYFGLFPFKWKTNWEHCFEALRGGGRLFVAPILQTLILNRAPRETLDWASRVASWDFARIIPCHFDGAIDCSPREFRQAFSFLEKHSTINLLPDQDFKLLRDIDAGLNKIGIVPPAKDQVP